MAPHPSEEEEKESIPLSQIEEVISLIPKRSYLQHLMFMIEWMKKGDQNQVNKDEMPVRPWLTESMIHTGTKKFIWWFVTVISCFVSFHEAASSRIPILTSLYCIALIVSIGFFVYLSLQIIDQITKNRPESTKQEEAYLLQLQEWIKVRSPTILPKQFSDFFEVPSTRFSSGLLTLSYFIITGLFSIFLWILAVDYGLKSKECDIFGFIGRLVITAILNIAFFSFGYLVLLLESLYNHRLMSQLDIYRVQLSLFLEQPDNKNSTHVYGDSQRYILQFLSIAYNGKPTIHHTHIADLDTLYHKFKYVGLSNLLYFVE